MKNLKKKIIVGLAILGLFFPAIVFAARTDALWDYANGTSYYSPNGSASGVDILLKGSNHYLNWGSVSGFNGYGIRDNNGTIEFKNSGGSWIAIGTGGGGGGGGGFLLYQNPQNAYYVSTTTAQFLLGVLGNASTTNQLLEVHGGGYFSGTLGIGTTTPGSILSVGNLNGINFSTATSTFNSNGGINLINGCFAINGICLGSGSSTGFSTTSADFWLTLNQGKAFSTTSANFWGTSQGYLTANQTVTLSGDVTGSGATSITTNVGKINGTALSGLATGILKNTATTGVPSIATNGTDYTLVTAQSCSAGNHVSAITAAGVATCSADSGGGSGTVNSGLLGQNAYYAGNGTTVTGTSTISTNVDQTVLIQTNSFGTGSQTSNAALTLNRRAKNTVTNVIDAINAEVDQSSGNSGSGISYNYYNSATTSPPAATLQFSTNGNDGFTSDVLIKTKIPGSISNAEQTVLNIKGDTGCVTGLNQGLTIQNITGPSVGSNYASTKPCIGGGVIGLDATNNFMDLFGNINGITGIWNRPFNIDSNIANYGVNPSLSGAGSGLQKIIFNLLDNQAASSTATDPQVVFSAWSHSPGNSGSGWCGRQFYLPGGSSTSTPIDNNDNDACSQVVAPFGTLSDSAGNFGTFTNPSLQYINGYGQFTTNGGTLYGLDSWNYPAYYLDYENSSSQFNIPYQTRDIGTPYQKAYIFTVTGITNVPTFNGDLYTPDGILSGKHYQMSSYTPSLVAGAGTLVMIGTSTPASSGTLTHLFPSASSADQTITYTNVTLAPSSMQYHNSLSVDETHGLTTIGTSTITNSFTLSKLGTPAGALLAVDPSGTVITTTTPSGGGGGGSGTVTSVATNNGLTGGTITTTGTLGLDISQLSTNALVSWNGTQLSATGTPQLTVGTVLATSTTATSTLPNLSITNALNEGQVQIMFNSGYQRLFTSTSTTPYSLGQTLINALAIATASSTVRIGPGTYDTITNTLTLPTGASIIGSGRYVTYINSEAGTRIFSLNTNNYLSSFSITATLPSVDQLVFDGGLNSAQNILINDVYAFGAQDVVYCNTSSNNCSFTIDNSELYGNWDVVRLISGTKSNVIIKNSTIAAIGPGITGASRGVAAGIGTITLYNDIVSAINGGTDKSAALFTDGGTIIMQGGSLTSNNNSTAIAYDAQNISGSISLASDVNFHTASTTGIVNFQNVIANSLYEPFGSLVTAPSIPVVTQVADGGAYSSGNTLLYQIYGFNGTSYSSTFAQTVSLTISTTGNCSLFTINGGGGATQFKVARNLNGGGYITYQLFNSGSNEDCGSGWISQNPIVATPVSQIQFTKSNIATSTTGLPYSIDTDLPVRIAQDFSTTTSYSLLEIGSTTPGGTLADYLSVSNSGFGTTTLSGLKINGSATSTSNVGFNLTGGCFSIAGTCIGGASGSVTAVSIASANGFAGSSSGGSTPALTLSTTITGILKGNGTAISTATLGTDYVNGSGTSGHCVQWGASNALADAGSACGSGGSGAPYPFFVGVNATTTLTQFNGGLTAFASSTIGSSGINGGSGLTVNGNATTTGNLQVGLGAVTSFTVDAVGHQMTGGTSPTCSTSCSTVIGDDNTMIMTTGVSVSSATVNFASTWVNAVGTSISPVCIPTEGNGGTVAIDATTTPTSVTVTFLSALTTKNILIMCRGSLNATF